ncbi:hypothetical protein Tco_0918230 [Tanacetum coccineum]
MIKRFKVYGDLKESSKITQVQGTKLKDHYLMYNDECKHKWTNPESTNARRNRFRVTDEESKHFGDDVLPRPPGLQRLAKSQRSGSNSTASSGSNPMMYQEFMKEQYELDRKAKNAGDRARERIAKAVNPCSKDCGGDESATNQHMRDGSGRRRYH